MTTDTKRPRNGAMLFLGTALLLSSSIFLYACRHSSPPEFSVICLGDGFGGADCSLPDGTSKYLAPSELKNFWMTTNADMKNFSAWCYDTTPSVTGHALDEKAQQIARGNR